jgi:hypothetical protein
VSLFTLVFGVFCQILGLVQIFDYISDSRIEVAAAILAGGIKITFYTTTYGIIIYLISLLITLGLEYRLHTLTGNSWPVDQWFHAVKKVAMNYPKLISINRKNLAMNIIILALNYKIQIQNHGGRNKREGKGGDMTGLPASLSWDSRNGKHRCAEDPYFPGWEIWIGYSYYKRKYSTF